MNYDVELTYLASDAIANQADTIARERTLAVYRIIRLKQTIANRAREDAINDAETKRRAQAQSNAYLAETERRLMIMKANREQQEAPALAHKSSDHCALEPGWDVA